MDYDLGALPTGETVALHRKVPPRNNAHDSQRRVRSYSPTDESAEQSMRVTTSNCGALVRGHRLGKGCGTDFIWLGRGNSDASAHLEKPTEPQRYRRSVYRNLSPR
jgi:hypothetical protein